MGRRVACEDVRVAHACASVRQARMGRAGGRVWGWAVCVCMRACFVARVRDMRACAVACACMYACEWCMRMRVRACVRACVRASE